MKSHTKILFLLFVILFYSCDKGIEPYPENNSDTITSFSGKITFTGNWPSNIQLTYLVLFKEELQSSADFFPPNLSYIVGPIPNGVTEYIYNSEKEGLADLILAEGVYNYVVVVQSEKPTLSLLRQDWTVAGIYNINGLNPASVEISKNQLTENINILCDFDNPPVQPPLNKKSIK